MLTINLGDEVECIITGFKGTAVGKHYFLHGATSITVQPILEHYGHLPETENFAESQLKVTKPRKAPVKIVREI